MVVVVVGLSSFLGKFHRTAVIMIIGRIPLIAGKSNLVLKPINTNEVSSILKYCNENRLAVCPQSGNTGLVGGSVPVFDEIVLSMKLMNKIIETNELEGW